jgi:hypothetical protein
MAKVCRDCSNGQCEDKRYLVFFTTKISIRYSTVLCVIRERYWVADVTGKVGGLSLKDIPLTFNSNSGTFIQNCLVLEVNGIFLPMLPSNNFLDEPFTPFFAYRNGLKPFGVEYVGGCNEKSFSIDSIELLDSQGQIDTQKKRCKCTNGDQEITCSSAEGGICCIPKSILDALCAKV